MSAIIQHPILHKQILDKGYLFTVEHFGSDERIIEAARMSTNKGFLGWDPGQCPVCEGSGEDEENPALPCRACEGNGVHPGDAKLLRYLYTNKHATPFEMAGLVIETKAPLMVFREWHRHRTQSYAEMSARYVPLPNEDYMPTLDRLMANARNASANKNKQARGASDKVLTEVDGLEFLSRLADLHEHSQRVYQFGLDVGVPKELARLANTVSRYSRMRASANLRNWLGFLTLRTAPNAQWEIRQYAWAVHESLHKLYPRTMQLWDEGEQKAAA